MSYYRSRPYLIKQDKDNSCWAACLESWSRTSSRVPKLREKNLYTTYGTGSNGGLNLVGLNNLRDMLAPHGIRLTVKGDSNLQPEEYETWLRASHFVLMYQTSPGSDDWHAWVVYGVDNFLCYMDPRNGTYKKKGVYNATSPNGFYIFWMP